MRSPKEISSVHGAVMRQSLAEVIQALSKGWMSTRWIAKAGRHCSMRFKTVRLRSSRN